MYDVIVIGGGPAGMTAALYALRNGKTALVIEKAGFPPSVRGETLSAEDNVTLARSSDLLK